MHRQLDVCPGSPIEKAVRIWVVAATAILCLLTIGPSPSWALLAECRGATPRSASEFSSPGPYAVGVRTMTFIDPGRATPPNRTYTGAPDRTLVTEIWYPATSAQRDAPVDPSGGPYPVIVHSHGFLDSRVGEAQITRHLASHGFIVAAADYPLSNGSAPGGATVADVHNQPGDATFVVDGVLAEFAAVADADRIGASGLSLGGLTTLLLTYHPALRDPRIQAAVPMAAPACMFTRGFFRTVSTPRLVLHGDSDPVVPYKKNGRRAFQAGGGPRHLARLRDGSHLGFSAIAPQLDQSKHLDTVSCVALAQGLGSGVDGDTNPWPSLGGSAEGIRADARRCGLPCADGVPTTPSMGATRHHELTNMATLAFFEGYLKDDLGARCLLDRPFTRENPDTRTVARGR